MGRIDDTYELDGMYPLVKVSGLTKDDLLRCEKYEIIIYDLEQDKYFSYKTNQWVSVKIFSQYKNQWDKATESK
jgi:hypothetical protein